MSWDSGQRKEAWRSQGHGSEGDQYLLWRGRGSARGRVKMNVGRRQGAATLRLNAASLKTVVSRTGLKIVEYRKELPGEPPKKSLPDLIGTSTESK